MIQMRMLSHRYCRKQAYSIFRPSNLNINSYFWRKTDTSYQHLSTSSQSKNVRIQEIKNDNLTLQSFINTSQVNVTSSNKPEHDHNMMYIPKSSQPLKFHIETYGCQMNSADSDIVRSVMISAGHEYVSSIDDAQLIFANTCAIRENAESKVFHRLNYFQSIREKNRLSLPKSYRRDVLAGKIPSYTLHMPLVGVLGCMAERLKTKLLDEKAVDIVCGPDAYRDLPRLIEVAMTSTHHPKEKYDTHMMVIDDYLMVKDDMMKHDDDMVKHDDDMMITKTVRHVSGDQLAANTRLSLDETYADIVPTRDIENHSQAVAAFVSIMRGCNNMCSFCIVPFTRGRERSRPIDSIVNEIKGLVNHDHHPIKDNNIISSPPSSSSLSKQPSTSSSSSTIIIPVREVVLLGQNVNGYHDISSGGMAQYPAGRPYQHTAGFQPLYRSKKKDMPGPRFVDLLDHVSMIHPEVRIRFTSPHPKDFPVEVLELIASRPNICKSIHLPLQSGSSSTLQRMRRGYTQEAFLSLVKTCRDIIPGVSLSTDVIAGFCGETEEEHQDTLHVMREVEFDAAFMFAYSLRDRTHAAHTMTDDVPADVKQRRLQEIIDVFHQGVLRRNQSLEVNQYRLVLVEGPAKQSYNHMYTGRTDGNKRVVFPMPPSTCIYTSMHAYMNSNLPPPMIPSSTSSPSSSSEHKHLDIMSAYHTFQSSSSSAHHHRIVHDPLQLSGSYVVVKVLKANGPTLRGIAVASSSIQDFHSISSNDFSNHL